MLKITYKATITMFLLVFIFLFRNESPYLDIIANYSSLFIFIIGILIISIWWSNNFFKDLNKEIKQIYHFWILMVLWLILVPIIFFNKSISLELFYQGLFHDYRYIIFSILPFMFVTNRVHNYYINIFRLTGNFAVICGVIAIIISDKSLVDVSLRKNVYSIPYYLWWVVCFVYPYLYLKNIFVKKGKVGIVLFGFHLILSLIFLKRAGFINAFLLILFSSFIFGGKLKSVISVAIILGLIFVILLFFGSYTDLLFNRFSQDSSNIEEWDRNMEVLEFFKVVSEQQLITGFGMNNYIKMFYVGVLDNGVNALHLGFYNIIYKGGLLYLVFMLFLAYNILILYKYIHLNSEIKIGFIIGLIYLIGFSYENSWSYVPTHFFTLLPIYRAIYLRRNIVDYNHALMANIGSSNLIKIDKTTVGK